MITMLAKTALTLKAFIPHESKLVVSKELLLKDVERSFVLQIRSTII